MAVNPTRDGREFISNRRSLAEWPLPGIGVFPLDYDALAIIPTRDDRDLISHRRSLLEWPVPRLGLSPWDEDISRWIVRSRRGLDNDIARMRRNLFALEPFAEMQNSMNCAMRDISVIEPHELQSATEFSKPGKLDLMDNAYEVGKDGKLHFKAYFNAKNFDTGDISVRTDKNQLIVHAQKTTQRADGKVSESLGRSIPLPPSVDRKTIKATLTKDGVLIVEASVESPNYRAIRMTPESGTGLAIQPASCTEKRELAVNQKEGLEVVTTEDGSKKVHLELVVGEHFAPDDVKIWSKGNRVYVQGKKESRKEEHTEEGVSSHSECHEFYKAFVAPQVVDASKAHAELGDGHLVVEAPLFN